MRQASVIAIDGPAGSGKSTLGRELAARLGYLYFDTGVLYRAVAWLALHLGVDPRDENALVELAARSKLDVTRPTESDGRPYTVTVDGRDVTWAIREPSIDANVSLVSEHPGVRRVLLDAQREVAARGAVVLVGRDIGTVVAPQAEVKVYLDASLRVRARRRYQELRARGTATSLAEVEVDMRRRDEIDSHREAAPLRAAPDAVVLTTDALSVTDELDFVASLVASAREGC